jgi:hypothetical protein
MRDTYRNIKELMLPANVTDKTKLKHLKHLGSWLGAITLGRNKAIVINELDLKSMII